MNNRYSIYDPSGQRILFAAEETDCCTRWCLGKHRPFQINVLDFSGSPVIKMVRPCTCGLYCCPDSCGNVSNSKNVLEIYACCTSTPAIFMNFAVGFL